MILMSMVIVTTVLLVSAQEGNEEFNEQENNSALLVKSLRFQLMQNNYDYSRDETNNTENGINENIERCASNEKKTRKNFYLPDLAINEKDEKGKNFASRANENKKNVEHVSKKDILHYIDDGNVDSEKPINTKSTAKYKFLKVRRQYRRSGRARLILEENKEGVAIVNLNKGPFPELRLPNARRQYMHDHGDAMTDDEEVPPPTVNTSDPEAAADEIKNQTETELTSILTIN